MFHNINNNKPNFLSDTNNDNRRTITMNNIKKIDIPHMTLFSSASDLLMGGIINQEQYRAILENITNLIATDTNKLYEEMLK